MDVPAGTFLIGPIALKSNVTLHMEKGATLLGSPDREDYPKATFARQHTVQPLVGSVNAENITITGGGVIDGQRASVVGLCEGGEGCGRAGDGPSAADGDGVRPLEAYPGGGDYGAECGVLADCAVLRGRCGVSEYEDPGAALAEHGCDRSVQLEQYRDRPCVFERGR